MTSKCETIYFGKPKKFEKRYDMFSFKECCTISHILCCFAYNNFKIIPNITVRRSAFKSKKLGTEIKKF